MGVGVHLMPYLTDIGHSESRAGLIIAIISGMTFLGKITLGSIVDRWGVRVTVALAYGLILAGILLLNAICLVLFFKEIKLATFDAALAAALGFSPLVIHYGLMSLVSITAVGAFEAVGRGPLEAAASLRAAPLDAFFSVAAPLAARGFLTAATLGFAHTVGEFGVVLMIGGKIGRLRSPDLLMSHAD